MIMRMLQRLQRLRRWSLSDWCLLIKITVLLGSIRIGLWFLPLRVVWQLCYRVAQVPASTPKPADVARIARLIARIGAIIPRTDCLPRALTGYLLLARRGYPVVLRIGVMNSLTGSFAAHAWLELHGNVVLGNLPDLAAFTPLMALESN
jgi:hypothetical protein